MTSYARRKQMEEQREFEAYLLAERQARCIHYECDAVSFTFEGRVRSVKCRECGLENNTEFTEC